MSDDLSLAPFLPLLSFLPSLSLSISPSLLFSLSHIHMHTSVLKTANPIDDTFWHRDKSCD